MGLQTLAWREDEHNPAERERERRGKKKKLAAMREAQLSFPWSSHFHLCAKE